MRTCVGFAHLDTGTAPVAGAEFGAGRHRRVDLALAWLSAGCTAPRSLTPIDTFGDELSGTPPGDAQQGRACGRSKNAGAAQRRCLATHPGTMRARSQRDG